MVKKKKGGGGTENVPNELDNLAKAISRQNIKSVTWLLLAAYNQM